MKALVFLVGCVLARLDVVDIEIKFPTMDALHEYATNQEPNGAVRFVVDIPSILVRFRDTTNRMLFDIVHGDNIVHILFIPVSFLQKISDVSTNDLVDTARVRSFRKLPIVVYARASCFGDFFDNSFYTIDIGTDSLVPISGTLRNGETYHILLEHLNGTAQLLGNVLLEPIGSRLRSVDRAVDFPTSVELYNKNLETYFSTTSEDDDEEDDTLLARQGCFIVDPSQVPEKEVELAGSPVAKVFHYLGIGMNSRALCERERMHRCHVCFELIKNRPDFACVKLRKVNLAHSCTNRRNPHLFHCECLEGAFNGQDSGNCPICRLHTKIKA